MLLRAWIEENRLTYSAAASLFGVHLEKVRRWCLPAEHLLSRIPSRVDMARVVQATKGAVTAADFYELPAPLPSASGLRALPPPARKPSGAAGREPAAPDASRPRKRHHSHASKKAWRSRKRRAAARAAAMEARP